MLVPIVLQDNDFAVRGGHRARGEGLERLSSLLHGEVQVDAMGGEQGSIAL